MIDEEQRKRHARHSFRLLVVSLALFGFLVLIVPLAAPLLNGYSFLRLPLGLFLVAKGRVVAIIGVIYWAASRQDRLDRRYGLTNEL
jgi:putative solute:sodium symporter small subunit